MVYNFAKFIEWPSEAFAGATDPLVFCAVGEGLFGSVLEYTLSGKTINGRPLVTKRLKPEQDLRACHLLFIGSSEKKRLAQIIQSLQGASVLTVSEISGFVHAGGIVNFILEENKVRFEINRGSAERARLKISSKLLALAKAVWSESHGGRN
jgi:hypothetical protein